MSRGSVSGAGHWWFIGGFDMTICFRDTGVDCFLGGGLSDSGVDGEMGCGGGGGRESIFSQVLWREREKEKNF